ncbi:MAG TPA: M64 family metallopeptidase [Polyangiaceae bacterium]|nr:M64 family metallopeptidase [Polyangiaceae bacterium]
MRRWLALGALLGVALSARSARALDVETLRDSGPVDTRFNIAVLGDGYRTQDQAKLTSDATSIVSYLFGVSPLKEYAELFNVKLIHVISNDNGADNGDYGATRDTALDSYFNCNNIERLLCVDGGAAASIAAQDVPEFNFAVVIVNDTKYGGSGGAVCASSANSESFEVMAHEIGHSLAKLADEYDYAGGIAPCNAQQDCREANATLRTARDEIKWNAWILPQTQVPTPEMNQFASVIGLFEGGRYQTTGTYRPHLSCKMKDLGSEYCSVCSEQFVRSFWSFENIQMIEEARPGPTLQVSDCNPIELKVTTPPITPSTYRFTWTVDGQTLPDMLDTIQLLPGALMQGTHDVSLLVEDATMLVRNDPDNLLRDAHSWSISVTRNDCPTNVAGAGGVAGAAGAAGAGGDGGAGAGGDGTSGMSAAGMSGQGGVAGSGGGGMSGGAASSPAGPIGSPPPPPRDSGCGCSVPPDRSERALPALALLLALGLRRVRSGSAPRPKPCR